MATNDQHPPLSVDELMTRCMGEVEFANTVLQSFLESCDEQIDAMEQLCRDGSMEKTAKLAHRMKGTAATIAAGPLKTTFENIEHMAHGDAEADTLLSFVDDVRMEIQRLRQFAEHNLTFSESLPDPKEL